MKIAKILAAATATASAALLAPILCGPPAQATTAREVPVKEVPAPDGDGTLSRDIAGGSTTTASAAPFAAQVSFDSAGTNMGCTGSQIAASWVITAKHCNSTSLRSVRLGTSYLGTGGAVRSVAGRYAAPAGDVLLLKLSTPHYGSYVGLSSSFPATGIPARVYGWGDQSEGSGAMSYYLKAADVSVVWQGVDNYGGPSVRTRSESGHTLSGDSGGPLIVNGKLAGVLSTSDFLPAPNPSKYTGYYNDHASVVRNLAWITSVSGVRGS
ncbi:S1 family peptidase [Arthrobacter globiformis]|uniref:S1 family peptidase n=1 Tax=Arthrobacter globiformis TaxID=1665 RepID=UPI002790CB71|nr:trypsin-like serine protease [Arthrobacter globiformis]MDQ0620644.1 trypsin [Arthrobacter globiformis]